MSRSGMNLSRNRTGIFNPILTKKASLLFRIMVPNHLEFQAVEAIKLIGKVTAIRHWPDFPGRVEVYGDGAIIQNWEEAERWLWEANSHFGRLGILNELDMEFYVVDHSHPPELEFGSIYIDDEGRRQVQFTFGGPRLHWIEHPLSDYRLVD